MTYFPQLPSTTPLLTDEVFLDRDGASYRTDLSALGTLIGGDSRWAGKGFATFGDSITAPGYWQAALMGYLGATLVFNGGVSGRKMREVLDDYDADDIADADVVIVSAGTNDFSNDRALGTMADAAGAATFYGDTKDVVETLFNWKPSLNRLVLFAPLARSAPNALPSNVANGNSDYLREFTDALIEIGALYGCPVLDLMSTGPVNYINGALYLSDGLHPTNATTSAAAIAVPATGFFNSI